MKITAIRPIFAQGERRTFVFIKVETDQPGLVGWGEATVEGKPRAVAGCVQDMEPMILGFSPLEVEHCWQVLYRGGFWRQGVIGLSRSLGHRPGIVGHQRQGSGQADLRASGRKGAGPCADVHALRRRHT